MAVDGVFSGATFRALPLGRTPDSMNRVKVYRCKNDILQDCLGAGLITLEMEALLLLSVKDG